MKKNNLVVFGPTNSGKTTLLGYFTAMNMGKEKFESYLNKMINEMGAHYNEERKLTYLFDTSIDEWSRIVDGPGTSMRKHFKSVEIEGLPVTVIDTPGTTNRWKNGYQGIFMGDIGVFVIELKQLLPFCDYVPGSAEYEAFLHKWLAPIALWNEYGRIDRLIIAISKCDQYEFNRFYINRVITQLNTLLYLKNVPIIPISVNVRRIEGTNILQKDRRIYNSEVLSNIIAEYSKKLVSNDAPYESTISVASIDKLFKVTKDDQSPALRIKVLKGQFSKGDNIMLVPVVYENQLVRLFGTIRSLKEEGSQTSVDSLLAGDIGGIKFTRLSNDRYRVPMKEITLANTSMLFSGDKREDFLYGHILSLSIDSNAQVHDIVIGKEIQILWFGKTVLARIIACKKDGESYTIRIMNTNINDNRNKLFYLPKNREGNSVFTRFVLQYDSKFICASFNGLQVFTNDPHYSIFVLLNNNYMNIDRNLFSEVDCSIDYSEDNNQTSLLFQSIGKKKLISILFSREIDPSDILDVDVRSVDIEYS